MRELILHLLDVIENSIGAGATVIEVVIEEDLVEDKLRMSVEDNGKGMDKAFLLHVYDPFVTTRTTRKVGLGIPLFKAAAEACNGQLQVDSELNRGARLEVEFQHSHIDRMPLGDLAGTLLNLLVVHPDIHWLFTYRAKLESGDVEFVFDDTPIKEELSGLPLTEPSILAFLRKLLREGVGEVQQAVARRN